MRFGSFNVTKNGNEYLLSRDSYPRVNLIVDHSMGIVIIKDIVPIDKCSAVELAKVLEEVELFIKELPVRGEQQ